MLTWFQAFLSGVVGMQKLARSQNLYIGRSSRDDELIYHRWDCEYGAKIRRRGRLFNRQSTAVESGSHTNERCQASMAICRVSLVQPRVGAKYRRKRDPMLPPNDERNTYQSA
jgi:hypothetical protein